MQARIALGDNRLIENEKKLCNYKGFPILS